MATPVVLPKQGNSVEACLIMAWKKQVGDVVKPGEVLVEVETDKAIVEVASEEAGVLLAQFFADGDEVPVMTNIAVVGQDGDDVEIFRPKQIAPEKQISVSSQKEAPQINNAAIHAPATSTNGAIFISPRARLLADKHGLTLQNITPTGPDGRIIERDIQVAIQSQGQLTRAARDYASQNGVSVPQSGTGIGGRVRASDLQRESSPNMQPDITEIPMRGIRKTIADRMRTSLQESAQLTLHTSADVRALLAYRKRLKHSSEALSLQKVSINDLLLFVVSRVLLDYPELNATLENNMITQYGSVNAGFAMDTPRGLLVPVVQNAHQLSLKQLSQETRRMIAAVQENQIKPDELQGGTFTVTNLGTLGIEQFTPIINPPQVAILGVGSTALKPVQVDDEVQFIPHMSLSLTIDHQAVDGAPGARFLQALTQALREIDLWLAL